MLRKSFLSRSERRLSEIVTIAFPGKDSEMNSLTRTTRDISRFFFDDEVPFGLAIVRILLPLVLMFDMVPRWFHARELYSLDGAAAPLAINYGVPDMLPTPSGAVAVAMASVLLLTLITSSIGWCSRLSLALATTLYTYLTLMDCLGTMTKYTVIASHGLLLLTLSDCGSLWSIDALMRRRREHGSVLKLPTVPDHVKSSVWPRRLIQLLIGIVYLGAAFTKMHTPAFFSSDQMRQWMLTNVNSANPIGEWFSFYPGTLVVSAYVTIIWEVLFVFLAWRGWGRFWMLALGVTFHAGTSALLGLHMFPLVCCSLYFAFLTQDDAQRIGHWYRRLVRRGSRVALTIRRATARIPGLIPGAQPLTANVVFGLCVPAVALAGVGAEYQLDPLHDRNPNGRPALVELDADAVRSMLKPSDRIREYDKFLSFDIGSEMFGDVLVNHRNTFRYGERVLAQCTLSPPHEDMWIECNLHDSENRLIDRVGQVIDRTTLRSNYAFEMLPALEPGQYFLVVRSGGQEITRRAFTLTAN